MNVDITLSGSYPRKEELVKATWNFDKGLLSGADLAALQNSQRREVVELQKRIGAVGITDGLLTWQDAFRPLVETSPSFEVGGVTRLFETNRFYRQPLLNQEPRLQWARLEPFFPHHALGASNNWKAVLPSPYWFTRVVKDNLYHDEAKLGWALAKYVNDVARHLERAGYRYIQFQEPQLFYESKPDVGFCNELLAQAVEGLRGETIANFTNGNAAPHHSFLQTAPVTTIGIDFVETLPEKIPPRLQGKQILAQVVNSQESHLETPAEVQELVARVEAKLKPSRLWATNTWDFEFVPSDVAARKAEVLASLKARKVTA